MYVPPVFPDRQSGSADAVHRSCPGRRPPRPKKPGPADGRTRTSSSGTGKPAPPPPPPHSSRRRLSARPPPPPLLPSLARPSRPPAAVAESAGEGELVRAAADDRSSQPRHGRRRRKAGWSRTDELRARCERCGGRRYRRPSTASSVHPGAGREEVAGQRLSSPG